MADLTLLTYLGATVISLFVGFMTGIFGVGGGFLMTPALICLLALPGNIAVGTSLAVIFVNSSFGMFKRHGSATVDVKLGLTLASGSIIGIAGGLSIMELLKNMSPLVIFGTEQVAVQYILLCVFLLLLVGLAIFLFFDLRRNSNNDLSKRIGLFAKFNVGPFMHFASLDEPRLSAATVVALGVVIGILTGLLGIGGGVIVLPGLIYLIGQHTVKAAGTSLLVVWLASLVAGTGHIVQCNVELTLLACMLVGGIVGTNFGTHLGLKLKGSKIRLYFVYAVIVAAVMVAVKLYAITFNSGIKQITH